MAKIGRRCADRKDKAAQRRALTGKARSHIPYRMIADVQTAVRRRPGLAVFALVGVLAVCSAGRAWMIANTVVISRDGTQLVAIARRMSADPLETARNSDIHVGYPAMVAWVHGLLPGGQGPSSDPAGWDLAGQFVSLAGALLATAGLWCFARQAFDWKIATLATLLFSATRKWAVMGADVLTDAPMIACITWSACFALRADEHLAARRGRAMLCAVLAGALVGVGYAIRPEAIVMMLIAMSLWLTSAARGRAGWARTGGAVALALGAMIACMLPYMLTIGAVTNKRSVDMFLGVLPGGAFSIASAGPALPAAVGTATPGAIRKLIDQLVTAHHPLLSCLTGGWLVVYLAARGFKLRIPLPARVFPRSASGAMLMLGPLVLICPAVLLHYARTGMLSHRYVMFPAMMLAPAAAGAIAILWYWLKLLARTFAWSTPITTWAFRLAVGGIIAGMAIHASRPSHADKMHFRTAADYVQSITAEGETFVVADNVPWIAHYAQRRREDSQWALKATNEQWLRSFLARHAGRLFVLQVKVGADSPLHRPERISPRFTHIRDFPPVNPSRGRTIKIYRIAPPGT